MSTKKKKNKKIKQKNKKQAQTDQPLAKTKKAKKPIRKKKTKSLKTRGKAEKKQKPKIVSKSKEIEKGLKSIYQDGKGKMPNMANIEFKKRNNIFNLVILIIIILVIIFTVSFLGFLVFQPKAKFTGEKINLEIKAPFNAVSGEKVTYQIKYANAEDTAFSQAKLFVYLPYGFIFESSNKKPAADTNDEKGYSNIKKWQLNNISGGESGTLEITGKLIGSQNTKQQISATLSYIPVNFSSEFQKTVSFNTEITDSLVDFEIEYPNQVANQEKAEFNIKLKNNSQDIDLNNLQVELNYPAQFTLNQSKIIANEEEKKSIDDEEKNAPKIWAIDNLAAQAEKDINFQGEFQVEESQTLEFNIKVKLKGPADEYFIQGEKKFTIEVIKGELLNNLIIQGSNQNKPVNFGGTLNYLLSIQNKSKNTLGDLKVRLISDSPFLNWSTLKDDGNGINEGHQILWTKEQTPELAVLFPEDEIEINIQIKLKDYQKKYKEEDYQVRSFFETQINKIDNKQAEVVNESNIIINEINTNLNLKTEGRYFDENNQTIGSGPLPPIVGQKTSYKIFWTITNSLHDIENIEVKAKLPDYVSFENQENTSAGNLYKNQNNEVVWQISRIPTAINESTAEFEISITPSQNDADKILTLLPKIDIEATDSQTQGRIFKTYQGITTNLDNDPLAKGKGLVQEE